MPVIWVEDVVERNKRENMKRHNGRSTYTMPEKWTDYAWSDWAIAAGILMYWLMVAGAVVWFAVWMGWGGL